MGIKSIANQAFLNLFKVKAKILRDRHHLVLSGAQLVFAPPLLTGERRLNGIAISAGIRVEFKCAPLNLKLILWCQLAHGALQASIANGTPGTSDVGNDIDAHFFHSGVLSIV